MHSFRVGVRQLCERFANNGSLDSRFLPAPTGMAGIMAQKAYQRRQGNHYQRELKLTGRWQNELAILNISGRADGAGVTSDGRDYLEEIKTLKMNADQVSDAQRSVHFSQLYIYAYLWCKVNETDAVSLVLTYLDEAGKVLVQHQRDYQHEQDSAQVENWFTRFIRWQLCFDELKTERNTALQTLAFPYSQFRQGQRELATGVYRTIAKGKQLLVEAPTGIGKTLATLFPAVRQLGQCIDKVVYLSAKNSTQYLPLKTVEQLNEQGARLRAIVLTGKQRACLNPTGACLPSCPYATNFYDKFYTVGESLLTTSILDFATLEQQAKEQQICPYFLAQMLAPWFDVIIGDYNYGLDNEGSLSWLTEAQQERYALLVDEAHNVCKRAKSLYSAQLNQLRLKRIAKAHYDSSIARSLTSLRRQLTRLINASLNDGSHLVTLEPPQALLRAARRFCFSCEQYLAQYGSLDEALLEVYFEVYQLLELSEQFSEVYRYQLERCDSTQGERPGTVLLKLTCLDPAPLLKKRWGNAHSVVLFSATLQPLASSASSLGLNDDHYQLCLPSPYDPSSQGIFLIGDISTRYRHRQQSYLPLARLIEQSFTTQQVNQLVFFPSFAYLQSVAELIDDRLALLLQSPHMNDSEREQFIAELANTDQPTLGFAVLGGIFSEGIDLSGRQLSSVMVVGVGLAQFNPSNECQRRYLDQRGENGFALVYQYPGMQRVVQAVGRLIRSEQDIGTVILVDDRFTQIDYQRLLPAHWRWQLCSSTQVPEQLRLFWQYFTQSQFPSQAKAPALIQVQCENHLDEPPFG
ncbi:ATP-dependent DNA helicase [Celerinatantimonas diazotrophica]|uniref:DNA excision repair protein ERCC-2 n=1 Tax=Celerinatantimonas diazotrophica TaxID=412034 RepID=A0A4R1K287_9GAMM|nr:ATP-dependent DNA helicase [Celerinatantimonas diazotrophica]TCK57937.1 DNA excision repair protein ERCC-2 [Celerinatantimonas diazotrophica]CAG9297995.1 ATP-dependent DNA helicase DinG [Celerinatantimonas diazotrophica]